MKRAFLGKTLSLLGLVAATAVPSTALADDPHGLALGRAAPATWGAPGRGAPLGDATSVSRDAPVTRAREILSRARVLDDAAIIDEKAATELAARLPPLRAAAKTARERAERATVEDRELLVARADDLEADVIISEAEVTFKRKTAAENRQVARELRMRAIRVVREEPATQIYDPSASSCDPPFRYNTDGRKVYRVECLK